MPTPSDYQWIKDALQAGEVSLSEHIIRELLAGRVTLLHIHDVLFSGMIIETHSHPQRKPSFVALGYTDGKPLHVMFTGSEHSGLTILVVYEPTPPLWLNPTTRSPFKEDDMQSFQPNCFFCSGRIKPIMVGNFDYRLEGNLYVVKNVPAGLCLQCGEKYLSYETAQKIEALVNSNTFERAETVRVFTYPTD